MKLRLLYVLLFVVGLIFTGFKYQEDSFQKLLDRFDEMTQSSYQEKIYLHTDKPYYATGDEIWFKTYLVNGKNLRPSSKSNLMVIELINPNNKLYKRIKIPLVAGTGWGNFTLADSLKEGNYRIRAYTNWMRNFDEDFYYDRTFKIGDIRSSQLVIKADYSFQKSGKDDLINAKINYANIGGAAYSNKEVNYTVDMDGKVIAKGKATTNSNGDIDINFKNTKPEAAVNGIINSSLVIAERTIVNKVIPITNTSNDVNVQFFPEGGDLVNNIRSKVAFKAVGKDGLGKAISGIVRTDKGDVVARLLSKNKGMGFFSFTPTAGNSYIAKIEYADGSSKEFNLPKAKESGVVLNVATVSKDSIVVRVLGNVPAENQEDNYTVIAQSNGNLIYSIKSKLSTKGGFLMKLPKSAFPAGISQFTVFDKNNQPLAERLAFFYNKNSYLNLNIAVNKENFLKREQVELNVTSLMPNNKGNVGSFSVSVIDESKVPVNENEENTIFSELLLNSDLKGFIEEPNYYFTNVDDKKVEELDLLMLTQGWRRFKWQNLINNIQPNFVYKPEKTLALRGRVMNNKKPVPNADLIIFTSKAGGILQVKANANGEFNLDSLVFPDSTNFVIQARSEKGKKFVEIEMDDKLSAIIPAQEQSVLNANINSSMIAYLKNSKTYYEELLKYGLASRTIMLDEVRIVEEKKKMENSSNLNGSGNADKIITSEELQNAPTLEFALQGKVAGLMFRNGQAYFMRNGDNPVQIILDGMYVEPEFLNSISPQDVESVEILKNISYTAIYGSRGGGGVIVINTKRGGGGGFSNSYSPGIIAYTPLGLFVNKEFYMPAYDKPETNNNMADLRATIYWNPAVITDSTGTAKVKFFNADGTGKHRVVIEGMDLEGHIGRKVIRYTVN